MIRLIVAREAPHTVNLRVFKANWRQLKLPASCWPLVPAVDQTLRLAEKRVAALNWMRRQRPRTTAQILNMPLPSLLRRQAE